MNNIKNVSPEFVADIATNILVEVAKSGKILFFNTKAACVFANIRKPGVYLKNVVAANDFTLLMQNIDTALYQGQQISPYYDSMLAKVVAFGSTRKEAIAKMKRLLEEMVLHGITTNQEFHLNILNDPTFIKGNFNNTYLEQNFMPRWRSEINETISA